MWASLTTTHLSRISEDFIIYSSAEFGFIALSDAYRYALAVVPLLSESMADEPFSVLVRVLCPKRRIPTRWNCFAARLAAYSDMSVFGTSHLEPCNIDSGIDGRVSHEL